MNCLFCKIVRGEIPAYKLYEDDFVIAFLDIHPRSNGHTLIISKKHFVDFMDLDQQTLLRINDTAKIIVKLLEEKLHASGFCINTNYLETQEIKHFHLHIVPNDKEKIKDVQEIFNILKNKKNL